VADLGTTKAARSDLRHWSPVHLDFAGLVEPDSNTVERTIRPIELRAKKYLFVGSDGGAESRAIVASLIQTAKLNDVEPFADLRESGKPKSTSAVPYRPGLGRFHRLRLPPITDARAVDALGAMLMIC